MCVCVYICMKRDICKFKFSDKSKGGQNYKVLEKLKNQE